MDDRVASAVEAAFPERTVVDVTPAGPSWNPTNETAKVDFDDGEPRYLKLAVDGDGSRIGREIAVIEYVAANRGIRAPRIVASDTERDVPYLATAPLSGTNLVTLWGDSTESERAELVRQVGAGLADLHAERFEDHGHIVGGNAASLELDTGPWSDVLIDTIGEMQALSPSDRFEHRFDEVIAAVDSNRERLDDAPAALLHGDPAKPNCICAEDGIGFVDWEIAHVGDPARDLHRARSQQIDSLRSSGPEQVVEALYEGYRERAGDLPPGFEERAPIYDAVRLLGTAGFFEKVAEFVDEPAAELAAWLEGEMDRRIAEIS